MSRLKIASKFILAFFMIGAGVMHFARPDFYLKIMPPYLPAHYELVILSGVCEVVLGILLLVPKVSKLAAWGIIALLIAVFPANIYIFQNPEVLPTPPILAAAHESRTSQRAKVSPVAVRFSWATALG